MRFQSSNHLVFEATKKTPKAERGNSWNNTFPIHFPEIFRAKRRSFKEIPRFSELKPAVLDSAVSGCLNGNKLAKCIELVGGVIFFLDSWGNDGSKFLHWLREYLCVVMLCHGSHPPQVVPKSSKSFRDLDFCERYEAGPLLKGKQRFSPPRIRKNITSLSFGKIFSRPKKRHWITSKAGGF